MVPLQLMLEREAPVRGVGGLDLGIDGAQGHVGQLLEAGTGAEGGEVVGADGNE